MKLTTLTLATWGVGLCLLLSTSKLAAQPLFRGEIRARLASHAGQAQLVARVGIDVSIRALVVRLRAVGMSGSESELQARIAATSGEIRYVCDTQRDRLGRALVSRSESRDPAQWTRCPNGPRHLGLIDQATYRIPLSPLPTDRLTASEARVRELENEVRVLREQPAVMQLPIVVRSEAGDAALIEAVRRTDEAHFTRERADWISVRWTERIASLFVILVMALLSALVVRQSFHDHRAIKALRQRLVDKEEQFADVRAGLLQAQSANAQYASLFAASHTPQVVPTHRQEEQWHARQVVEQAEEAAVDSWHSGETAEDDVWDPKPQPTQLDEPYEELVRQYKQTVLDHGETRQKLARAEFNLSASREAERRARDHAVELEQRLAAWSEFFLGILSPLYYWSERISVETQRMLDDARYMQVSCRDMLGSLFVSEGLFDEAKQGGLVSRIELGLIDLQRLTGALCDHKPFITGVRSGLLEHGVSLFSWMACSSKRRMHNQRLLPAPQT